MSLCPIPACFQWGINLDTTAAGKTADAIFVLGDLCSFPVHKIKAKKLGESYLEILSEQDWRDDKLDDVDEVVLFAASIRCLCGRKNAISDIKDIHHHLIRLCDMSWTVYDKKKKKNITMTQF